MGKMTDVLPLPALDQSNLAHLREIYGRCARSDIYSDERYAQNRNVFIDDDDDFAWIIDHVVKRYGINPSDVSNSYSAQRCRGINFNVVSAQDWIKPHVDYNPTKLNLLLSDDRSCAIVFTDSGERWDYRTPALLNVAHRHYVDNMQALVTPRIMLQVFITKPFDHYRQHVDQFE